MWRNVEKQNIDELPHRIDGLCQYLIKNVDVKARRKALSSYGRRWSKDSSTNWVGYRKVRFPNCRGSRVCKNKMPLQGPIWHCKQTTV